MQKFTTLVRLKPCEGDLPFLVQENTVIVNDSVQFSYDHFVQNLTTERIFDSYVKDKLDLFIQGYSLTIFAYGQSGSGKTYTISGYDSPGLVQLSLQYVNQSKQNFLSPPKIEYSCLEIYNEQLLDLQNKSNKPQIVTSGTGANSQLKFVNTTSTEFSLTNMDQLIQLLTKCSEGRKQGSTLLNQQSSRSHLVHFLKFSDTYERQLVFVDLAGSERLSRSGATGDAAKEGASINQSLLTLGIVIEALSKNATFVPFRDSQLTRLLQSSFTGKSVNLVVGCVSSDQINKDESIGTFRFVQRCGTVTGKVEKQEIQDELELVKRALGIEGKITVDTVIARISGTGDAQKVLELEARLAKSEQKSQRIITSAQQMIGQLIQGAKMSQQKLVQAVQVKFLEYQVRQRELQQLNMQLMQKVKDKTTKTNLSSSMVAHEKLNESNSQSVDFKNEDELFAFLGIQNDNNNEKADMSEFKF